MQATGTGWKATSMFYAGGECRSSKVGGYVCSLMSSFQTLQLRCPTTTCGGAVVQQDVTGRQRSLPDDELVEGTRDVVAIGLVVAGSDDQVGEGVAVVVVGHEAGGVSLAEGAVDVDLQTVRQRPREEHMGPEGA